jgi:ankyrin repeat protein
MEDLQEAACDGHLTTIKRLYAEGVDVTERDSNGVTAIMMAVCNDHALTVKFLQAAGASTMDRDNRGFNTLLYAAMYGKLSLLQYCLQETGASISDTSDEGDTVWDLFEPRCHDPVALTSLLKIMVMLDNSPPAFVAKLSPANAELATRGRYFRAQLPSYLEQQRASVIEHCPLPPVLLPIVVEYSATTPEDMWTDGLHVQAPWP